MNGDKQLGLEIRMARNEKGLTLEELGESIGYVKATISAWELGKYPISQENLNRINEVLGTNFTKGKKESEEMNNKELSEIKSIDEMDTILSSFINKQDLETSYPKLLSKMLFDLVYLIIGYNSYLKVKDSQRFNVKHPTWEKYNPTGYDIGNDLWLFLDTEDIPTRDFEYYNQIREQYPSILALKIHLMCYGIGGERFDDFSDRSNEEEMFALELGCLGEDKGYELIKLIPNSESENEIINEFRFAIINLADYLMNL